jgi:hypothetical protein
VRLIEWRYVHICAYDESLQFWYGNGGERQRSVDMELHGFQWRHDGKLFRERPDLHHHLVGGHRRQHQPIGKHSGKV